MSGFSKVSSSVVALFATTIFVDNDHKLFANAVKCVANEFELVNLNGDTGTPQPAQADSAFNLDESWKIGKFILKAVLSKDKKYHLYDIDYNGKVEFKGTSHFSKPPCLELSKPPLVLIIWPRWF